MITVIVPTLNDEARLAACLAPLVPASMEGVVKQLIVVDRGSSDDTLEVADDAGALILKSGGFGEAVAAARSPWIMILDPGVRIEFGWEACVKRHFEARRGMARFRIELTQGSWLAKLAPPPVAAHLLPKGEFGRLRLKQTDGRLEARVGQVHVLEARARI